MLLNSLSGKEHISCEQIVETIGSIDSKPLLELSNDIKCSKFTQENPPNKKGTYSQRIK